MKIGERSQPKLGGARRGPDHHRVFTVCGCEPALTIFASRYGEGGPPRRRQYRNGINVCD
jgi:hypothetical protein